MSRRFAHIAAAAVLTVVYWAGPAMAETRQERALNTAIAEFERIDKDADPISAGADGDRAALMRLPDQTRAYEERQAAALTTLRTRVAAITRLPPDAALNQAMLLREIDVRIDAASFDQGRMPFDNGGGFFSLGDYLAYTTPIATAADAEAWIARLEALPAYYEANIVNTRRGVASGFTQPLIVVDRVLEQARAQVETIPNTLMIPLASMPASIPAAQQESYRTRAQTAIARIMPQHRAFIAFMEREYVPAARAGLGIRSVPNGEAYYRFLVRFHTTTELTPEEIHAIGQSEVTRIRAAMDGVIKETGFTGDFAAFQRFLRTDPQFYASSPQDLLEKASEIAKRADDQMPRLFGTLPRLPYGVREVPAEQAEGSTTAYYSAGSPALGMAGGYWVNTVRLDQRPLYELPALTLHEAVPGHHQQIAIAQELSQLPYFRRNASPTAFIEGWGLYAESLGHEMGIYRTPYERFGSLSYEMWRACRLVADTGIHWMGWDIEQARRCFAENSALSPHNIQTELERYIANPGQALAYKIGELRLKALRREAETALGDRFDVRKFHDAVLTAGPLPLDVLETRVRAWIAAQQAQR